MPPSKQVQVVSAPSRKVFNVTGAPSRQPVRASYDAARSTDENAKLWQYTDALSAAAANNPGIRQTIRNRARYEVANNSYAAGMVDSLASDTVGPCVQLQLGDGEDAETVEKDFEKWARAVNLWKKVRILRKAKATDGEAFALFFTNRLVKNPIKLDVRILECDHVESWVTNIGREDEIDGIRFDESGNPVAYRVLKNHPGDFRGLSSLAGEWIPAKFIAHYFRSTRPGQVRGISELLPALSLFGQLRKYTSAVLETATRAAEISGVMYTDLLPDGVAAELADPATVLEIERNAILSLPEGWKLAQLKAEQPTTAYKDFKAEIISEAARCVSMPYNVAAGNSSGYNYASGRLDHQTYQQSLEIERADLALDVLDKCYLLWLDEYAVRKSMTAKTKESYLEHEWYFTNRGHVDPNKEAQADDTRFANGSLTRASYFAKQGLQWKRELRQGVRELIDMELEWNEAREKAGLKPAPYPFGAKTPSRVPTDGSEEPTSETTPDARAKKEKDPADEE